MGAAAGVPGSLGVVEGDGQIPYKPEALKIKKANRENWIDRDPELKCYLPGIPRAMYMPYPFSIIQGTNRVQMGFAFTSTVRMIHMDPGRRNHPTDIYGLLGRPLGWRRVRGRRRQSSMAGTGSIALATIIARRCKCVERFTPRHRT